MKVCELNPNSYRDGRDMRVKFQTSPSDFLDFKGAEKKLCLKGEVRLFHLYIGG